MQRIGVLNGNNITYDHDLAGLVRGLTDGGVIQGGEISENKVQPVQAVIACQRSNGQKLMLYFESDEQVAIPSSGTFKVYIEVNQAKIDDGSENAENGTGIAEIKTGPSVPSQNSLLLASVADGAITDERNLIPKIQSVASKTSTLEEKLSTAEGQITQLVEAGTPSYLGIIGIVGEKYTMEDTLFLQKTPTLADSAIAINVGDTEANKEQHIQRISNGQPDTQIKLKMDKFGAPTTSVIVEVRKGIKVDVSEKEAYWYGGDELLASASLPYTTFQTEGQEITVNLNQAFQLPKGELYSVVVKQENDIVNGQNFYRLYCDSTQYSEAFSAVAVNGSSRVRSLLMPYCESDGFLDNCLVKEKKTTYELGKKTLYTRTSNSGRLTFTNGYEEHTVQNVQVSSSANLIVAEGSVRAEVCSLYFGDKEKLIIKPNDNGTIRYQYNISPGSYRIFGNSNRYGQSESMMLNNFVVNEYTAIIYPKPIITHPPRRREEIGGETEITIFGFHIENKWVHRTLTTQTAQTGSIPLGNAVGYKTDYLSDGTEILIPYYNKPG